LQVPEEKRIIIRNARPQDLAVIGRIERISFPTPWTDPMYRAELSRETTLFLALEVGGELAAYVCAWTVREEGHILKIAVAPGRRRQGLGRELMAALTGEFRSRGVSVVWLEARETNREAREFYGALEFHEVGVRRGYYSDTGEDAVLMMKLIA